MVRKILFHIHQWIGIGLGLYVAVISISGSAIVCRREIGRIAQRVRVAAPAGHLRMRTAEVEQEIIRAYPGYQILWITRLHEGWGAYGRGFRT